MKLFPRSHWTSVLPKPYQNWVVGLPYFRFLPPVEFCTPGNTTIYLFEDPVKSLQLLLSYAQESFPDINYNYALAPNTEGVFVLGGNNLSYQANLMPSPTCRVLLLMGDTETPTDTLKKNQKSFLEEYPLLPRYVPGPMRTEVDPVGNSVPQIHFFDLIFLFSQLGYYIGYNRGLPSELLTQAIYHYQDDFNLPLTGQYDTRTYKHLQSMLYTRDAVHINA